MAAEIVVREVQTRRDLQAFVRMPWRVYRWDPNWVPPLISERLAYLDRSKNPLLRDAQLALFLAKRRREVAGTIAVLARGPGSDGGSDSHGVFGFFESVEDYAVSERLLDSARAWLAERGVPLMRGPLNLTDRECPGVLVAGTDCPPVMLAGHTPPYYREFLERYGLQKYDDLFAWRAWREQIGERLEKLPEALCRVAQAARERGVTVRRVRLEAWGEEVAIARNLFNVTLRHLPQHVDVGEAEFRRLADPMRGILDPDLALFAELDGRAVGFCVSLPDLNRVLIHLNGRLFPFGWLKAGWYSRRIDVLTFKLMGVLPELRYRGIDALLFEESLRTMVAKGYRWLDGSVTSEHNVGVNLLAGRFGAERYKHYRVYQMAV